MYYLAEEEDVTTNKAPEVNLRNIVLNMLLENNKGRLSHLIVKDTLDENKNLDKNQRAPAPYHP